MGNAPENFSDMKGFVKLVEDMRKAQKLYFKTKSGTALKTSKKLEQQVDDSIVASRMLGRLK